MDRTPATGLAARGRRALARRFGVDARALAALRISLGLLIAGDLLLRSFDLVAFYTDAGTLPRAALVDLYPGLASLSVHAQSGAAWVQGGLFLVTLGVAGALAVGYRTRLATVGSLVLVTSLALRNPVVLNAGDALLVHLLLWGAFLPLGRRWSVDALRGNPPDDDRVVGVAPAALLVQVVVVYTVNAGFKLRHDAWLRGEALQQVLELDRLTVFLGPVLARFPLLLEALNWLWLAMVVSSVLLVVLTGRNRALFASLFAGMHLGMLLTMRLGLFPLVSVAALLPFLPAGVWDALEARLSDAPDRLAEAGGWRDWSGRLRPGTIFPSSTPAHRTGPTGPFRPTDPFRPVDQEWPRRLVAVGAAALLVLLLGWNAATLGYVDAPGAVESTVDPSQYRWDMFAAGGGVDGWYVVPGTLETGVRVDAFHRTPVRWDRPPDVAATYPTHRWLVYLVKLRRPGYADHRQYFAEYLCRSWNARHEDELVDLAVYYVAEPEGDARPERVELVEHTCSPGTRGL